MKELFKHIFTDRIITICFFCSLFFLLVTLASLIVAYRSLPFFLPLFNQMPWGEDRVGTREQLFIPFIIAIATFFGNFFLASSFNAKMPLVARIVSTTSLLLSFFTFLFTIRVMRLML